MKNLLRGTRRVGCCVQFSSTVSGIVADFPAFEALSFSHAFRTLLGGEFLKSNCVDFHGLGVVRGTRD